MSNSYKSWAVKHIVLWGDKFAMSVPLIIMSVVGLEIFCSLLELEPLVLVVISCSCIDGFSYTVSSCNGYTSYSFNLYRVKTVSDIFFVTMPKIVHVVKCDLSVIQLRISLCRIDITDFNYL